MSCDSIMHYIVVHLQCIYKSTCGGWDEPRPRRKLHTAGATGALLRLDSPGTPGPPGGLELQEAHLEQLTVMLQWLDDAERCALKGWPDLKADVHRTFELQRLFARRSILRVDHLRKCDPARLGAAKNLSELSHLTYDGFTDEDARAAAREVVGYGALQSEITRESSPAPA